MTDEEADLVRAELGQVYDAQGVGIWMTSRNEMLSGRRPMSCGFDEVMAVVERLTTGAFG